MKGYIQLARDSIKKMADRVTVKRRDTEPADT
jgi:hypothetical protein